MSQLLWTIQHKEAYLEFEKTGVLVANNKHLFCQDDFRFAYNWISEQMRKRIGEPPKGVTYPIWAWYQWEGNRKPMDLRCSGYAKRGTELVQISFEADETSFLLSDFDEWHHVLSNEYVARDEHNMEEFYSKATAPSQKETEASWERIFDITQPSNNQNTPIEGKSIQATLWNVYMSQVRQVKHFIAK